jgi:drug/metabolite transporter (DMT)-like permease
MLGSRDPALLPALGLAFAALAWGGNVVAARAIAEAVDPVSLNLARWLIALAVLAPLAGPELLRRRAILAHHWRLLVLLGSTGIALFHLLQYAALQTVTATNVALLSATAPLLILLTSALLLKEPISRRQLWGVTVSIIGAVVVVSRGDLDRLLAVRFAAGDLIAFAAMVAWAVYSVLLRLRPAALPPLALIVATIVPGLALSLGGYAMVTPRLELSPGLVAALLYIGLVASCAAYVAWNAGVAALGPARAGAFLNLIPLAAAAGGVLLLGERLEPYHATAAFLILAGLYFATTAAPGSRR